MKRFLNKSLFLKNVSILMSGTVIAQLLTVAISPILTRIYGPEAFGILAIYTSIVSILSVIVTGRYELAIVIPKNNKDAMNLLYLSCLIVTVVSLVTFIVMLVFNDLLSSILNFNQVNYMFFYVPLSIFLLGIYQSCSYWSTRKKQFKRLSISQVLRSTSVNGTQVSGGVMNFGGIGLIGGQILGQLVATATMVYQLFKEDRSEFVKNKNFGQAKRLLKEYKDFPIYSSGQAFVNSISQNMMPFILLFFFNPVVVGYYALSLRLLQMPVNLVGNSVKQVFYQRASEEINNNEDISNIFLKTTLLLAAISFLPAIIIIICSPYAFSFFLGETWYQGGIYARWVVIWLFFFFIARPAITIFQIYRKQAIFLLYEVIAIIIKVAILLLVSILENDIYTIIAFSIVNSLHYIFLIIVVTKIIKKNHIGKESEHEKEICTTSS
ncbi:oligosaccharide flippase family protein [Halalkalibacterium halodurans]|uniref:lipopolysaccharide biosynthesis protein n=1 Tax=Halalkalibacterium halodurans TaxID=86665 RepID=UPI002E22F2CF|nr:oligosaccharide flippase family protein [Halalkalibacterium halodurans]MED4083727.1 oligosaccharide flippase family protein [Halalkalibacterium halodurans]MED4106584.1 oligosaccharide flippase family protein [Halalkalibacterium halodurans]MED4109568.1 oligosaccharide flippase family protein [Halalkalibacterium halodurans]MED4151172.1 oligosaccharide flippase family protein [Halalkalibacterium halodurans]